MNLGLGNFDFKISILKVAQKMKGIENLIVAVVAVVVAIAGVVLDLRAR